jgi:hypothetical protein
MKTISSIRSGLRAIPGGLVDYPPGSGYEGAESGVSTTSIWPGVGPSSYTQAPVDDDEAEVDSIPDFDPVIEVGADVDETFPALGGAAGERIRQSVLIRGMDALGWYVSFHRVGVQCGIYVSISGIVYLIRHAFSELPISTQAKSRLAFHAVLNHELFHFATDYAIAQSELVHQEPWYLPAKTMSKAGPPGYCVLEEQLANAYMLQAFRTSRPSLRVKGKQAALRAFAQKQPEGYRDGESVRTGDWGRLLAQLASAFGKHAATGGGNHALWDGSAGYDWAAQFPIVPKIDWRYCPIHIVNDGHRLGIPADWLNFFSKLSGISESKKFRKRIAALPEPVQRAWERTKVKLQASITTGADFKKWFPGGRDVFSVRVNADIRAHLQYRRQTADWLAVTIGSHREMGHG